MYFDAMLYVQTLFMAAGGFALMLGLPLAASKIKGGFPLLGIAVALGGWWLNREYGFFW